VAATSNEIDEIQQRMAQIRRELHQDITEVVAGAEAATDWRRYARAYPWAAVAIAAAAGYFIVPRARIAPRSSVIEESDIEAIRGLVDQAREAAKDTMTKPPVKKSLAGAAIAMLMPMAWRLAKDYAMAYLEQWLLHQQEQWRAQAGPRTEGAGAPGRAPFPGGRTGGHPR
jgi:hypothetical protein